MKSSNGVDSDSTSPDPQDLGGTGNGNSGGIDARLRAVENRLIKLETRMEVVATKEDIKSVKIWVLIGFLSAIPATVGSIFFLLKLLSMFTRSNL